MFKVSAFGLFIWTAIASASEPLIEKGLDLEGHTGDHIEVTCQGNASAHGFLRLGEQRRSHDRSLMDQFSVSGVVEIEVKNPPIHQWVQIHNGRLLDINKPKTTELSLHGPDDFATPTLLTTFGGHGHVVNYSTGTSYVTQCVIRKVDPSEIHEKIGMFKWRYINPNNRSERKLFFQSEDAIHAEQKEYVVLGSKEAFDHVRNWIGKTIRVRGKEVSRREFEVDAKTMMIEEVPVLCNILVRYSMNTESYGFRPTTDRYYSKDLPYSSVTKAKEWAAYMCAWWNKYPVKNHHFNPPQLAARDYSCEAVCR